MKNMWLLLKTVDSNVKMVDISNVKVVNENYMLYIIGSISIIIGTIIIIIANHILHNKNIKRDPNYKKEEKYEDIGYHRAFIASLIMIVTGILILIGKVGYVYYNYRSDINSLKEYYDNSAEDPMESVDESESAELDEHNNVINTASYNYVAVLKIPKINFERGLVAKDSKYNTVSRNIQIIKESDMPDVENGNLILAGHSGNSRVSFFRRLVELGIGDEAIVTYNGKTYTYRVVNTYDIPKTGTATIVRNYNATVLTLITCRQGTNNQVVYICELESVT